LSFAGDSVWFGVDLKSSSDKSLLEDPATQTVLGQIKVSGGQSPLILGSGALLRAARHEVHGPPGVADQACQ